MISLSPSLSLSFTLARTGGRGSGDGGSGDGWWRRPLSSRGTYPCVSVREQCVVYSSVVVGADEEDRRVLPCPPTVAISPPRRRFPPRPRDSPPRISHVRYTEFGVLRAAPRVFTIVASSLSPSRSPLTCAPPPPGADRCLVEATEEREPTPALCDITSGRAVPRRPFPKILPRKRALHCPSRHPRRRPRHRHRRRLPEYVRIAHYATPRSSASLRRRVHSFVRSFVSGWCTCVYVCVCVCVCARARGEENCLRLRRL